MSLEKWEEQEELRIINPGRQDGYFRGTASPQHSAARGLQAGRFCRRQSHYLPSTPEGIQGIDAGYLIPGLVDMHAHLELASPAPFDASPDEKVRASAMEHLDGGVLA